MTDTVDLIVVGVEDDIPRADMSSKLVKAFKQEAFTFESLLDGAYGESAPYAAQTNVEKSLADSGREQLEKLGLICMVLPTGQMPKPVDLPPVAIPSAEQQEHAQQPAQSEIPAGETSDSSLELDASEADTALASFKTDDSDEAEGLSVKEEVSFDLDEDLVSEETALASFKKDAKAEKGSANEAVDFSDDLESVGANVPSVGLIDAKQAKNDVSAIDDSLNHDFSDQIEDVGADQIATGLKEAQSAKPDFAANVKEVDFSADVESIGIHEEDSTTPELSKSKLEEEVSERNLASFPKEETEESIDFSDELEILSSDAVPVASSPEGAKNKADVPEALAGGVADAGDELEADLIDPVAIEKEDKEAVEINDGGLSLSADNDAPLTTPKEKSNTAVDDGGLSLSDDQSAPLTAPKKKANPDAADDGGLNLSAADFADDDVAEQVQVQAASDGSAAKDTLSDASEKVETPKVDTPVEEPSAPVTEEQPTTEMKALDTAPEVQPAVAAEPAQEVETAQAKSLAQPQTLTQSANVTPTVTSEDKAEESSGAVSGGLVLPGQLSKSVVPKVVSEEDLDDAGSSVTAQLQEAMPSSGSSRFDIEDAESEASEVVNDALAKAGKEPAKKKSKKKLAVAVAGVAILAGAGSFAFMNAGSIAPIAANLRANAVDITAVKDSSSVVDKMRVNIAELTPDADLDNLSTGELLVNLSNNQSNGIVDLEPYFLESGDQVKRGPRIGAAIPAESEWMIRNRQSHPADAYFDNWSNRDADLSLFLALLDNLIEKGELEVAQQLSDRAKDKLFSVMSTQRLARAYSDVGQKSQVTRLMTLASRDTYTIKAPEERVLALSDYAFTEQAIGLNEGAMDTFLKTSILARSLVQPERRAVGLSSAAMYFHRSGRTDQAQELLQQSLQAGNELPKNTAARDLAIRYIALSEGRMGLFNQALEHTKLIVDPIATVSAYHGIALAIESSGDDTNARKVLNMAYRAGSQIEDPDERSNLLSKVVLASEAE